MLKILREKPFIKQALNRGAAAIVLDKKTNYKNKKINNKFASVIGHICMDITMVDVPDIK